MRGTENSVDRAEEESGERHKRNAEEKEVEEGAGSGV